MKMSPRGPRVVAIDANVLVAYVHPKTSSDDMARLNHLLESIEKSRGKLVIPMPSFAEYLVRADIAAIASVNELERKAYVLLAPFGRTAAFECAQLDRAALGAGDKKDGSKEAWQKIKFDRQIVAIAKAEGASEIVSRDEDVRNNAIRIGMEAYEIHELPIPTSALQTSLDLLPPKPVGRG